MINATGVHHIGIAVHSIDEQRPFYEQTLGGRYEGTAEVADQSVKIAFFAFGPPEHPCRIELLEPTNPNSAIAKFLEKRGPGLHHIAFAVTDIATRVNELKARGFAMIDENPRRGAHGNMIAFLHPKGTHSVLTELCEPRNH